MAAMALSPTSRTGWLWPAWRLPGPPIRVDAPAAQRLGLCALTFAGVLLLLWLGWLGAVQDELQAAQSAQARLRKEFSAKLKQLQALEDLQAQQVARQQQLAALEAQLPGPRDMEALLSDISRAGVVRALTLELLRPEALVRHDLYAEQRITLRLSGRYQDLAAFSADLAQLPWALSISNFNLTPAKDGNLLMLAQLRTLRPLSVPQAPGLPPPATGSAKGPT